MPWNPDVGPWRTKEERGLRVVLLLSWEKMSRFMVRSPSLKNQDITCFSRSAWNGEGKQCGGHWEKPQYRFLSLFFNNRTSNALLGVSGCSILALVATFEARRARRIMDYVLSNEVNRQLCAISKKALKGSWIIRKKTALVLLTLLSPAAWRRWMIRAPGAVCTIGTKANIRMLEQKDRWRLSYTVLDFAPLDLREMEFDDHAVLFWVF